MEERAEHFKEEASPFEKWKKDAAEMADLVEAGLLTAEQARRALMKEMHSEAPKSVNEYMEFGSSSALKFIAESREKQMQEQWAEQTADALLDPEKPLIAAIKDVQKAIEKKKPATGDTVGWSGNSIDAEALAAWN